MASGTKQINSNQISWLAGCIVVCTNLLFLNELGSLFPFTGLRAIVILPVIIIINLAITLTMILVTKTIKGGVNISIWISILIITNLIVVYLYPQEFRPNVYDQIKYSIYAIKHFDDSQITDLDLPSTLEDFSRSNCEIRDSQERYIVALYKYRKTIPLNGSFKVYGEEKTEGSSDKSIRKIEDIPNKLKTGEERLIWWTLAWLGK